MEFSGEKNLTKSRMKFFSARVKILRDYGGKKSSGENVKFEELQKSRKK